MSKQVTIKVYHPTGEFIKVWDNASFVGFTKRLNGGLGECIVELGEEFDYSGNDLNINNGVMIFITDKDTIGADESSKLIYVGYISRYFPWVDGHKEGIRISLLGDHTKLTQDIWKNGTTTTFDYVGAATDIGIIFRALMDRFIAETTNPKIGYTEADIQLTSTTTEYKFEMLTYREGIDILLSLAPDGWFWYVDQYGTMYFKEKPSTIIHTFLFGKHFSKISVERSMEKVKNTVLFYKSDDSLKGTADATEASKLHDADGGFTESLVGLQVRNTTDSTATIITGYVDSGELDIADDIFASGEAYVITITEADSLLKYYTDESSINDFGRRVQRVRNDNVEVTTDADKMAEGFIAQHKDPDIKVIAEILDNNECNPEKPAGYDIESINPGDTCNFRGFNESSADVFKDNMLITKVDYELGKAIITIEPMRSGIVRRMEDINKRLGALERKDVPTSYTT